jgi:hypothetical protein
LTGPAHPPDGNAGPADGPEVERQVEFLCPNGHRLHGPASLQGKPGECPECGSRFRIPTYDDIADEVQAEQQLGLGRIDGGGASGVDLPALGQAPTLEGSVLSSTRVDNMPRTPAVHPLASLFGMLWAEKPPEATVKLHLSGGEIVAPDRFAQRLSQGSYGVFSRSEPDGTHTLTVVAWESIVRVQVQGVRQLPPDLCD